MVSERLGWEHVPTAPVRLDFHNFVSNFSEPKQCSFVVVPHPNPSCFGFFVGVFYYWLVAPSPVLFPPDPVDGGHLFLSIFHEKRLCGIHLLPTI